MALTQTLPRDQSTPFRCYFFVPASAERWAVEQVALNAKRIFTQLKQLKAERKALAARQLGSFFHHIMMGSRILQLEKGPDRWVAFGFDKGDPSIPDWLREGLMDNPSS